jgi:hypothetical protein
MPLPDELLGVMAALSAMMVAGWTLKLGDE